MMPPRQRVYTNVWYGGLVPPAHDDIAHADNATLRGMPHPYLLTLYVQLMKTPQKPMAVIWPIAQVAARWLRLTSIESAYQGYLGSNDCIRPQDSISRVGLDDARMMSLVEHDSDVVAYSAITQRRRGAKVPIQDYVLSAKLVAHHCKTSAEWSRFHAPCIELAVRVDPATVGVPDIQELAESLCESAGEHCNIAHGCIEYGLAYHLGCGHVYSNDFGAEALLDRCQQSYLWSKVADPTQCVYRVGHATFLSPYFLERLSDGESCERWFMNLRPNNTATHFISDLPHGVKAFWLSTNPVEYMGSEVGLHRTTSIENSVVIGAELLQRLRSRGLTL